MKVYKISQLIFNYQKNDILWIKIYKQRTRTQIKQDEVVFGIVFSI